MDTEAIARAIADSLNVAVTDALREDVATASALVANEIRGNEHRFEGAAARVLATAVEKAAVELYDQRKAPSGIRNFADVDGGAVAVRVARDPMVAARPLLAPFLPMAFS